MTYDELLVSVSEALGENPNVSSGRWSDNEKKRYINSAVGELFAYLDQQYGIQTIPTVVGSDVYQLNSDMITASHIYLDGKPLLIVEPRNIPADEREGQPDRCAIVVGDNGQVLPGNHTLIVYPIPQEIYSIDVTYSGVGVLDTGDTIPVPVSYHDALIWSVASKMSKKLFVNKNSNWAEYDRHYRIALATANNGDLNTSMDDRDNSGFF
jgi:hypothetical protein